MAKIIIPTPLRKFTNDQASFETKGATVREAILELTGTYNELSQYLFDGNQNLRSFIRVYIGDEDINVLDKEETVVAGDAVISIIPAIAGG